MTAKLASALKLQSEAAKTIEDQKIKLEEINKARHIDLDIPLPLIDAVIEQQAKQGNWKERYQAWIDRVVSNELLKSILKYDWAYITFSVVTKIFLFTTSLQIDPNQKALVFGITLISDVAGVAGKLLATHADTNKDGKVDLNDTVILKNFVNQN